MKILTLRSYLLFINVVLFSFVAFAQGNLEGYIKDADDEKKGPVPSAHIKVYNSQTSSGGITDSEGFFSIEKLPEGTYTVEVSFMGNTVTANDVSVSNTKTNYYTFEVGTSVNPFGEGEEPIVIYYKSLFNPSQPLLDLKDSEFIETTPATTLTDIVSLSPATTTDSEGNVSFKGSRPGDAVYYVDGMRSEGQLNIPLSAIYTLEVITGGVPAMYGNTTAGVIVVETKSYFNTYED